MVEIPDRLRCLFTARVDDRNGSYVVEVPTEEIERQAVSPDGTYRVVVLSEPSREEASDAQQTRHEEREQRTPPVEEGEVREVTIETLGDKGDGIAKVERGYVVIVPETDPDDEVTVEIEQVRETVAFARVLDDATDGSIAQDPFDTLGDSDIDTAGENQ